MSCKRLHSEIHQSEAQQHFKLQKRSILSSVLANAAVHPTNSYENVVHSIFPPNVTNLSDNLLNTSERNFCFVFSDGSEHMLPGLYLSTLLSVAPSSIQQDGLHAQANYDAFSDHPIPIKVHTSLMACDFHKIVDFANRGMSGFENKTLHDAVGVLLAFEKASVAVSCMSPLFRWIAHYIWKHSILHGLSQNQMISSSPMTELTESSRWSICAILNGCSR